ncbi:LutC/YkgG family protein [Streptomyces sp. CA-111067]|uniref:LutC/YkgG family protein n=1 Tax=Streptomyces sp. CA-111067 TaxID=3240046 RepID=UPI003D952805
MTAAFSAPRSSRELVLGKIRAALADVPRDERPEEAAAAVERAYQDQHVPADPRVLLDLLTENLADYRARVHRTEAAGLPATVAGLLAERGTRTAVLPPGLPESWLDEAVRTLPGLELLRDDGTLTSARLDAADTVVTGCALAVAETGTLVLDAGSGQGRRVLTLVPDHHICVVHAPDQVVASVPHALPRLDPARPQTWISGPSATSDIELDRVEGVHGPRTLEVVLVDGIAEAAGKQP